MQLAAKEFARRGLRVNYVNGKFTIQCEFADNYLLEPLDKRWSKANKCWLVYNAKMNRDILRKLPIKEITPDAKEALNSGNNLSNKPEIPLVYRTEPLPFQPKASKFLLSREYAALFAPVGSGKTKIMIDVLQSLWHADKISQILIVGLVSIRENWRDEFKKHWKGEPPWEHIWITGVESYSQGGLYDKVRKWVTRDTCIVVDESSKIKNMKAKRTQKMVKLGEMVKYRYIMTGTPVLNGTIDLFAQFRFLHTDIIGIQTYIGFRNRYCIMGGFEGRQIVGYKRTEELMENLNPYSFVIDKDEALPHLPSQSFATRNVTLSPEQKRLIKQLKDNMISESKLGKSTVQNVLTQMLRISQIAGGFDEDGFPTKGKNPKLDALRDVLAESPDEPIVIFCRFIPELKLLARELPGAKAIHGGVKPEERHNLVQQFQRGEFQYLICQYQSGAIGINLHRARLCVFYSFDFSLELWLQSIGRIARMQQTRPMVYTSIIAQGSVDATCYRALMKKESVEKMVREALKSGTIEGVIDE